jgi:hypothetical protein
MYKISVGKPEGKRPLQRQKYRENNIKMGLEEIGFKGLERFKIAQDSATVDVVLDTNIRMFHEDREFLAT